MSLLTNAAFTLSLSGYEVDGFLFLLITLGGIGLFLPFWILHEWYFQRRRIKRAKITVSYDPPNGMSPAEMRYLFAGLPIEQTLAATLVDLVQRGHLQARKSSDAKVFLPGPKVSREVKPHEVTTMSLVSDDGSTFDDMYARVKSEDKKELLRQGVHDSLTKQSLISGKQVNAFFIRSLKIALVLVLVCVWWPLLVFYTLYLAETTATEFQAFTSVLQFGGIASAAIVLPAIIISVFIMKYRAQLLGRRWMSTPKLQRLWPQVVGFREYTRLAEKQKLSYDGKDVQKKAEVKSLPYAIALGFTKNWKDIVS